MRGSLDRPPGLAIGGLIVLVPVCWWIGGRPGALVGGVLAVAGLLVSPPTLFAVAHVLLLPLPTPAVPELIAFEAALAGVLFGDPTYRTARTPVPFVAVAVFVPLAWLAVGLAAAESVVVASAALVGVLTLGGYAIHRYELVRLGLVDDEPPDSEPNSGPSHIEANTGGT